MKFDVKVKNLGKISEAEFHIRPITVITGVNATGKSFFTKTLYSLLNVLDKNIFTGDGDLDSFFQFILNYLQLILNENSANSELIVDNILHIQETINNLQKQFNQTGAFKFDDYLLFVQSKHKDLNSLVEEFQQNKLPLQAAINGIEIDVRDFIQSLNNIIYEPKKYYEDSLCSPLSSEILDNFQITEIRQLISFSAQSLEIDISNILSLTVNDVGKLSLDLKPEFLKKSGDLSRIVFFESPAYWKVRDALKLAKSNPNLGILGRKESADVLTGVPNYFYDLDAVLNLKTKTPGVFRDVFDSLAQTLGGEFSFNGDDYSFTDQQGRAISKNLMSFGMTNLGMLQALLKYNVITPGSFIFIDEPETNLHPDWQLKLVEVLLVLAAGGVNIVLTTHSSDMLKALEVKIKKSQQSDEDFLAVHFIDNDGKLFEFESQKPIQQLSEARALLNATYEQLYFSDL